MAEMTVSTPIGAVLHIGAEQGRIVTCAFRPASRLVTATPRDPLLREARKQINAYFRKRLRRFELPLALNGTAFQCAVWELVASLEAGELISYSDVARAIGAPLAHRGVAAAMRHTPYDQRRGTELASPPPPRFRRHHFEMNWRHSIMGPKPTFRSAASPVSG